MTNKIRTYKEKPNCEIPKCPNKGWILVANRWICGGCLVEWNKSQNDKMFKQIVDKLK